MLMLAVKGSHGTARGGRVRVTVETMPEDEQFLVDENPNLIQFGHAMGASRYARMMAIYLLKETLAGAPKEVHEDIYRSFAEKGGTSVEALKADMAWANKILQSDLESALEREGISATEWSERISLGHLRTVARAVGRDGRPLSSWARVNLLLEGYHGAYTAAEFEDYLRERGHLPQKRTKKRFTAEDGAREEEMVMRGREAISYIVRCMAGAYGPYVQAKVQQSWARRHEPTDEPVPDSACTLLLLLAERMRREGKDIDLGPVLRKKKSASIDVAALLRYLAKEYEQKYPGASFNLDRPAGGNTDDCI